MSNLLWILCGLTFGVALQWLFVAIGTQDPHYIYRWLTVVLGLLYAANCLGALAGTPAIMHTTRPLVLSWSAATGLNMIMCLIVYYQNRVNLYRRSR